MASRRNESAAAPEEVKGMTIEAVDDTSAFSHEHRLSQNGVKTAVQQLNTTATAQVQFTVDEEKKVLRKIDRRLLPILLGAYFLQQFDKSSLSYASVFGLTKDANLVGLQYSWLGSILYLAQLVMQPLGAVLLVKLPTGKLLAGCVFFWGVSLFSMTACTSFRGLLGTRFMLGSFEALIAPTLIAVTQMWWRRIEQTNRITAWSAMNGLTFIVGSLVTYGLGHIKSSALYSYQIIFLFAACVTVVYSVVTFMLMPDSPGEARFLSQRDKDIAIERLKANQMGTVTRAWKWDQAKESILDLKTWCWFILVISISIPSGGIGTFGPLIIASFGFDGFRAILFNIPFGVVQLASILGSGWLATKLKRKGPVIALLCIPTIVGCVVLLKVPHTDGNKAALLVGYYILSVYPGITPLIFAWSSQNTAGETKQKLTTAVMFVGLCTGNVIGPLLYNVEDKPYYRKGLVANLSMFCLITLLVGVITVYLIFLNKQHAKARELMGKRADVIDMSMLAKKEKEQVQEDESALEQSHSGLENITDLKNEDFIFVY